MTSPLISLAMIAETLPDTTSSSDMERSANPPAMEDAFRQWWSRNSYILEDGGCGDVLALFEALKAASPNR